MTAHLDCTRLFQLVTSAHVHGLDAIQYLLGSAYRNRTERCDACSELPGFLQQPGGLTYTDRRPGGTKFICLDLLTRKEHSSYQWRGSEPRETTCLRQA